MTTIARDTQNLIIPDYTPTKPHTIGLRTQNQLHHLLTPYKSTHTCSSGSTLNKEHEKTRFEAKQDAESVSCSVI